MEMVAPYRSRKPHDSLSVGKRTVEHARGSKEIVVKAQGRNACPMPWTFPKTRWIMRFVARLLELKPELTPAAAVMAAIELFDKSVDVDPIKAAEIYADKRGPKE